MKKDTTIKQVIKKITKDIAKYILELKIDEDDKNIKFIDGELSRIEMREADIVAECNINNEDVILHLEIQSSYDDKMVRRMLRYYSDIKMIHPRKKIYQYVIYTGDDIRKMKKDIKDINLDYKFNLIIMKDINCEKLIKLDNPNALVLAILCDFKDKNKLETITQMLEKLAKYTKDDEKAYSNYLLAMETLTENMKVHKILQEAEKMLRTMTIEKSISYQIGVERGVENRNIEIARNLILANIEQEIIEKTTGLSIEEIKKYKKEIEQGGGIK